MVGLVVLSCCVQQMTAEDIMNRVEERSKSIKDISGICKITMEYLGINASMNFEFAMKKPDKFRIRNKGFMNFTIIGNGSKVLVALNGYALPLNESSNKEEAYKEMTFMNPLKYIEKKYGNCTPKLIGSDGNFYILEFKGKNGTAKVWISKRLWYPVKIIEVRSTPFGNATMILELKNLKINSGLSDDLFKIPKTTLPIFPPKAPPTPVKTPIKIESSAVTVKILKTNDDYARYLGIAINQHLPHAWWKSGSYTCNYVVSRYDVGKTFKCYTNEPIKYVEASVSSFLNYTWTIEVTLPNGKSKICTVNANTKCVVTSED